MAEQEVLDRNDVMLVPADFAETLDLSISAWGTRADIEVLTKRCQHMMPGAKDLSVPQLRLVAQYEIATGLNPFGGDFHAMSIRGALALKPHYRLIVKWAKSISDYYTTFEPVHPNSSDLIPEGAIAFKCFLVRADTLRDNPGLVQAFGMERAQDYLQTEGFGMLTSQEMAQKKYPPLGQTWDFLARKRALESAIKQSYGYPTTHDLARLSWEVDGVQTSPEDWTITGADVTPEDAALNARYAAMLRARNETPENEQITGPQAIREMFGDDLVDAQEEHTRARNAAPMKRAEPRNAPAPERDPRLEPRPWTAEQTKRAICAWIEESRAHLDKANEPITDSQRGLLAGKLTECFAGETDADTKRIHVLQYLTGLDTTKGVTRAIGSALFNWSIQQKDTETGDYPLQEHVTAEAHAIEQAWQVEQGQQVMDFTVKLPQ